MTKYKPQSDELTIDAIKTFVQDILDGKIKVCNYNKLSQVSYLRAIPFSKVHWGGGGPELFWGYLPPQFNYVDPPTCTF